MSSDQARRRLHLLFWLALTFAFVMATLPKPPALPGNPSDKLQHVAAFVVLTALAASVFRRAHPAVLFLSLSAFGALIECVQMLPVLHRDAQLTDWLADSAATIAVLIIVRVAAGRAATRPLQ